MSRNTDVVITGGTGFIGAHTSKHLVDSGYDVTVVDISEDMRRLEKVNVASSVELIRQDLSDTAGTLSLIADIGPSEIVHLGAVGHPPPDPRTAVTANIVATSNIFEAARMFEDQVRRVVWTSSTGVYAPPDRYEDGAFGENGLDESELVFPGTLYGGTKLFNEKLADTYIDEYGISLVGLRPTLVYGPFDEVQLLDRHEEVEEHTTELAQLFVNPALELPHSMQYGDEILDWLYIDDMIRVIENAIRADEDDLHQTKYNIGSGYRMSIAAVADLIREYVPEADISISPEGTLPWTLHVDATGARRDLQFDPEYSPERGVSEYIARIREDQDLSPL